MSDPGAPVLVACPSCGALNRVPRAKLTREAHGVCGRCKASLFTGEPLVLTGATFARHASDSDLPVLIDFWAAWCGPCRMMAPQFQAAAAALEPRVRLGKVDTEAEPQIAGGFTIRSIPTLVLIHKGREVARIAGAQDARAIVRWTERALDSAGL